MGGRGYHVEEFTEKPDIETAESYIRSGDYVWNSGIFMARRDVVLDEIGKFCPDILQHCRAAYQGMFCDVLDKDSFSKLDKVSFDYAVMEHTNRAAVLEVDFLWRDMGGWDTVMEFDVPDYDLKIRSSSQ